MWQTIKLNWDKEILWNVINLENTEGVIKHGQSREKQSYETPEFRLEQPTLNGDHTISISLWVIYFKKKSFESFKVIYEPLT